MRNQFNTPLKSSDNDPRIFFTPYLPMRMIDMIDIQILDLREKTALQERGALVVFDVADPFGFFERYF